MDKWEEVVTLSLAGVDDLEGIHRMQVEAFAGLLRKYKDFETNPGAEPLEKVVRRFEMENSTYHLILSGGESVGAIRIITDETGKTARISPMFVIPARQGCGIGRTTVNLAEAAHPSVRCWELDTIKEETPLCRFYESQGYEPTGKEEILAPNMTIIHYVKTK